MSIWAQTLRIEGETVARTEEEAMRKVVAGLFISLDGVVESPANWAYEYFNDDVWNAIGAGIAQADAVLLGRRTYLEFTALWPSQGSEVPMADFLNNTPKYVVSRTLDTLDWAGSSLLRGDLAEELATLKAQPGSNIQVPGSPTLVRSLLRDGLLDELNLMIAPIVVGAGMQLLAEMNRVPLKLLQSSALSGGVLAVTYEPANT
jgi:dihydrofolate reductase